MKQLEVTEVVFDKILKAFEKGMWGKSKFSPLKEVPFEEKLRTCLHNLNKI